MNHETFAFMKTWNGKLHVYRNVLANARTYLDFLSFFHYIRHVFQEPVEGGPSVACSCHISTGCFNLSLSLSPSIILTSVHCFGEFLIWICVKLVSKLY